MKYDRPVWQIMYECAAAMPVPFRYADVRRFFAERYPDIGEATIRAHLVGMSEGGRPKHVQFASRAPIFRRLDRGTYAVIPPEERQPDPDLPPGGLPAPSEAADHDPGPVAGQVDDYFAESAFSDAQVVEAHADGDDTDADETDGLRAPAGRARRTRTSVTFEDLVRRTGLLDLGTTERRRTAPVEVTPEPPALPQADVLLVGSAGERVVVPAPAREMYRDDGFQRARLAAQRSGVPWYVVSADAGLLEPHEWMSPDTRTLTDFDPGYRHAWAQWVAARLVAVHGPLEGLAVHVDAPESYLGPLSAALQDVGAVVSFGAPGDAVASVAAPRIDPPRPVPVVAVSEPPSAPAEPVAPPPPAGTAPGPVATVAAHLLELANVVPAVELDALPEQPGLYGWHVDPVGARDLNRGLVLPFRPGLAYVGQVGAWGLGGVSGRNLRNLVGEVQRGARPRSSTFRLTLATILGDVLHLRSDDDPRLTGWMLDHLGVAVWPVDDVADIPALLPQVVDHVGPPLNVEDLRSVAVRSRLAQLRAARA